MFERAHAQNPRICPSCGAEHFEPLEDYDICPACFYEVGDPGANDGLSPEEYYIINTAANNTDDFVPLSEALYQKALVDQEVHELNVQLSLLNVEEAIEIYTDPAFPGDGVALTPRQVDALLVLQEAGLI